MKNPWLLPWKELTDPCLHSCCFLLLGSVWSASSSTLPTLSLQHQQTFPSSDDRQVVFVWGGASETLLGLVEVFLKWKLVSLVELKLMLGDSVKSPNGEKPCSCWNFLGKDVGHGKSFLCGLNDKEKRVWMFRIAVVLLEQFLSESSSVWKLQSSLHCYREYHMYRLASYWIRSWNPWAQLVFISNARVSCDIIQIFPHIELSHPCAPNIIKFRNLHLHDDHLLIMHHNRWSLTNKHWMQWTTLLLCIWTDISV